VDVVVENGVSISETYFSNHPLNAAGEPLNDIVQAILKTNVPKAKWIQVEAASFGANYALRSSDSKYIATLNYAGKQEQNVVWTMTVQRMKPSLILATTSISPTEPSRQSWIRHPSFNRTVGGRDSCCYAYTSRNVEHCPPELSANDIIAKAKNTVIRNASVATSSEDLQTIKSDLLTIPRSSDHYLDLETPPSAAMIALAMIAFHEPCAGVIPEAIPKPIASGSASMPTVTPAAFNLANRFWKAAGEHRGSAASGWGDGRQSLLSWPQERNARNRLELRVSGPAVKGWNWRRWQLGIFPNGFSSAKGFGGETTVPDNGTTAMLLGSALAGLGLVWGYAKR
jgi:hypothetical protein